MAKQEAERARQREREEQEAADLSPPPKRRRSTSPDSVSTTSTNASRRSLLSARGSRSPSPQRRNLDQRDDRFSRRSSPDRSLSRSPPSARQARRYPPRNSLSPKRERDTRQRHYREREHSDDVRSPRRARRDSLSPPRDVMETRRNVPRESRSPEFSRRQEGRNNLAPTEKFDDRRKTQDHEPPRQRSLSPFSRRLAMTQSMNRGDR